MGAWPRARLAVRILGKYIRPRGMVCPPRKAQLIACSRRCAAPAYVAALRGNAARRMTAARSRARARRHRDVQEATCSVLPRRRPGATWPRRRPPDARRPRRTVGRSRRARWAPSAGSRRCGVAISCRALTTKLAPLNTPLHTLSPLASSISPVASSSHLLIPPRRSSRPRPPIALTGAGRVHDMTRAVPRGVHMPPSRSHLLQPAPRAPAYTTRRGRALAPSPARYLRAPARRLRGEASGLGSADVAARFEGGRRSAPPPAAPPAPPPAAPPAAVGSAFGE